MIRIQIEINITGTKDLEKVLNDIEKLSGNNRTFEVKIVVKESSTMC